MPQTMTDIVENPRVAFEILIIVPKIFAFPFGVHTNFGMYISVTFICRALRSPWSETVMFPLDL